MDEMTSYEFEYEFLQDSSYKHMLAEFSNNTKIDPNNNTFDKNFTMDEAEYQHILELAENGEYIDFEIPEDAPSGKRYSETLRDVDSEDEFIPVDMDQEFGGDLSG